jgi:hypothetical protein
MKNKNTVLYYLLPGFLLLISCGKEHLFDCLKSTGAMIHVSRTATDFNRIDVYNNPEVIIIQDSINSIIVEAGSSIIDGITTDISGGVLTIRNENKCNWVRSYSKTIAVYVHVKKLDVIHHYGSSTISSGNQLVNTFFNFNVWNSGDIKISLKADSTFSRQHSTVGDITLFGQSGYLYIYNNGNGFTYEKDFVAEDCVIDHRGTGDIYVTVNRNLDVSIQSTGNIYFSGNPQFTSKLSGTGQLIHQ